MQKSEIIALLAPLVKLHKADVDADTLNLYALSLDDLTPDQMKTAVMRSLREHKWFPKPVELRELAGVRPSLDAQAEDAFELVSQARDEAGANGAYRSVNFGPVTNRVVRQMGGWPEVWKMDDREWVDWGRKRFIEEWKNFSAMGGSGPALLPGALGSDMGVLDYGKRVLDLTASALSLPPRRDN